MKQETELLKILIRQGQTESLIKILSTNKARENDRNKLLNELENDNAFICGEEWYIKYIHNIYI